MSGAGKGGLAAAQDMAQRKVDDAVAALAAAEAAAKTERARVTQLESYREDYLTGLRSTTLVTASQLASRHGFLSKLHVAIDGQRNALGEFEARVLRARKDLAEAERFRKAIETLLSRREAEASKKAARVEQKLLDEYAARSARRLREAGAA